MGIDDRIGCVFMIEMVKNVHQDRVLEHVGVIAGMKAVSIAEHWASLSDLTWSQGFDFVGDD